MKLDLKLETTCFAKSGTDPDDWRSVYSGRKCAICKQEVDYDEYSDEEPGHDLIECMQGLVERIERLERLEKLENP